MTDVELRTPSYIVLALVNRLQPATAYDLKRLAQETMSNFWSMPHTGIYAETRQLADAGLLSTDQEGTGRRRRLYRLTADGLKVLDEWLAAPTMERRQTHDLGLLKLFAGGDPCRVASDQLEMHQQQLRKYEKVESGFRLAADRQQSAAAPSAIDAALRTTLAAGVMVEQGYISFWELVLDQGYAVPSDIGAASKSHQFEKGEASFR